MNNVRLEYADGSGDFPVSNDYRRIGLIRDPYNHGTTTVSTATTLSATKSLTLNSGGLSVRSHPMKQSLAVLLVLLLK